MHNQNTKKGFTLVELLVVIAIIGLLSTIAVVSLGSARAKARDTKRIADMKQFSTALEQYYADQGGYPSVGTTGSMTVPAAANDVVLGVSANMKTLNNLNTTAAGTATGSIGPVGVGTTVYMGNIPAYPTPGKVATADCSVFGSAYCYTSNTSWASGTYSTAYSLFWQLEAPNTAYGNVGTNCTTTNSGVTCA